MPAKIRLQRYGKKGQPFYHIVIADGRAPRDGRYKERIGSYNPLTNPATIDLDMNKAIAWLQKGAQPTDTTKAILTYAGAMYKNHLLKGVKKGALTAEQADAKFEAWTTEKQSKLSAKLQEHRNETKAQQKKRLEAEVKVNEDRSIALQAKRHKAAEEAKAAAEAAAAAAVEAAAPAAEAPAAEAAAEAPAAE